MTMKALVKSNPTTGLWLEDIPVPEIGISDVLIRVMKAAICGTDVHIYNWDEWAQKTIPVPIPVGHYPDHYPPISLHGVRRSI